MATLEELCEEKTKARQAYEALMTSNAAGLTTEERVQKDLAIARATLRLTKAERAYQQAIDAEVYK